MAEHFRGKKSKAPKSRKAVSRTVAAPSAAAGGALPFRSELELTQPVFARLIPLSVRSLAALEAGRRPTETVERRLTELRRLVDALEEVIQVESLGLWLQTPNEAFDGLKPLEVIDRGESDRIWAMIYWLRSGVPA